MSVAEWTAIYAALAGLIVAVLGVLTVLVVQVKNDLVARLEVVMKQTVPRVRAGGGANPYPLWNQLADAGVGGLLPSGRYEECGEECCSMIIMEQHGVQTSADQLRTLIGGPARSPLTTAADLQHILALNNVPATIQQPLTSAVADALQNVTRDGGAAAVLGSFVAAGVLHWILVTRADKDGCSANDPWLGRRRSWSWDAFRPLYGGDLVVVVRHPDAR